MPNTLWIPRDAKHSGISVTYTKSRNGIDISAFYDSFVGIEGESFTLSEFFELLGISPAKVRAALKIMEARQNNTQQTNGGASLNG